VQRRKSKSIRGSGSSVPDAIASSRNGIRVYEETGISTPQPLPIDPEEFAAVVADSFVEQLGECQQAHALEELARGVAGPEVIAMLPEPFVESTFEALARRSGTRVLFEAASRVCAPHLTTRMQQLAAEREAAGDRTSTLVAQVGELTVDEFFRIEGEGDEDACIALMTRPKQKRPQLLLLARDRRLPGLPLRLGSLTPPLSPHRIERILADMRSNREIPVPAAVDEFPPWLVDGARASAELMLGPTSEGGVIAVQFLRRLGEAELADEVVRLFPLELDYDEGVELDAAEHEDLLDEVAEVADDFARWLGERASGLSDEEISLAHQDVELALEFRANYLGAGAQGVWTDEELDAYLLSFVPRKVMTDEDDHARIPASLVRLFAFLGERGDVIPPSAEKLAHRTAALSETFAKRASDPTRRGPSGALVAAMAAEGVDIGDPDAMQAWIAGFNDRPFEERDAILGMCLPAVFEDETE
jgi:hypothetical protein